MTTPFIRTTTYDYRGMIINGNKKNKKNGRPYKVLTDSSSLAGMDYYYYNDPRYNRQGIVMTPNYTVPYLYV